MNLYQQFKKLNIDHSAIGLEQCDTYAPYFCTKGREGDRLCRS